MEYVNRQIFGFETAEAEYSEMIDFWSSSRHQSFPRISNHPWSMTWVICFSHYRMMICVRIPKQLKIWCLRTWTNEWKRSKQAAEKIQGVFSKYNQKIDDMKRSGKNRQKSNRCTRHSRKSYGAKKLSECRQNEKLQAEHQNWIKHESPWKRTASPE